MQSLFQLISPLAFLMFSGAFLGLHLAGRNRPAPLWFCASYGIGAAAFTIDIFRANLPPTLASLLVNALYMTMTVAFAAAIALRYRGRTPTGMLAAVGVGGFAAYLATYVSTGDVFLRTLAINLATVAVLCVGIAQMWGRAARPLDRIVFALLVALTAQGMVRPLAVGLVLDDPVTLANYTQSVLHLTLHLVVGALGIAMAMCLLVAHSLDIFEDLGRKSVTDPLTGILNRRGFEDEAALVLERSRASGEAVSVILADIDRFKAINDRLGHAFGDTVIAEMGALLRGHCNGGRIAGRLGGEEFALVLPARLEDARNLAEALRRKFAAAPFVVGGKKASFTATFGVASFGAEDALTDVLARADEALYLAKEGGRDRVACESDVQVARLEGALDKLERRQYRRRAQRSDAASPDEGRREGRRNLAYAARNSMARAMRGAE